MSVHRAGNPSNYQFHGRKTVWIKFRVSKTCKIFLRGFKDFCQCCLTFLFPSCLRKKLRFFGIPNKPLCEFFHSLINFAKYFSCENLSANFFFLQISPRYLTKKLHFWDALFSGLRRVTFFFLGWCLC